MPISTIGSNSLNTTSDLTINGQTVGKGGGNVSTNTAHGVSALAANTTGASNTAVGSSALQSNTTASENTAVGYQSGYSNTTGSPVSAFGYQSLYANTTGIRNTSIGYKSLTANTTGGENSASGHGGLFSNTTGSNNTAIGSQALLSNTTASNNTAVGYQAGYSQTTSPDNVFMGNKAGYSTSTGSGSNTFIGQQAGYSHTTGQNNQFFGGGAGYYISTGSKNSILGAYSGNQGGLDIRTSSNHIVLSDGDGNPRAYWNASGHVFFPLVRGSAGTYAARFTGSLELTVDTSSARYKDNIRDSIYGLADLLKIQSRQFEYKDDGRSDVGFIAEEMVEVIPEVVAIDKQGRPDAVSYDRLVSVCVKAIQELKTIVDAQAAEIAELKAKVA